MTANLLTTLPTWLIGVFIVVAFTALAAAGNGLSRPFVSRSIGDGHNDVGGFIFAAVGVVYAVLLAFTVFAVWEQYLGAEQTTSRESALLVILYRDTEFMAPADRTEVRQALRDYTETVINEDFPAMQQGNSSAATDHALQELFHVYEAVHPASLGDQAVYAESLTRLNEMAEARALRIRAARAELPPAFYAVLLLAGVLTIAFGWLFRMENSRMQALMVGLLGALLGLLIFLIVVTDHPFTGEVAIGSESYEQSIQAFNLVDQHGG